jgi:hypothetical protein
MSTPQVFGKPQLPYRPLRPIGRLIWLNPVPLGIEPEGLFEAFGGRLLLPVNRVLVVHLSIIGESTFPQRKAGKTAA